MAFFRSPEQLPVPPDIDGIIPENIPLFINSYPLRLQNRYLPECLEFRAKLDKFTRELLLARRQFEPDPMDSIGVSLLSRNMLLPKNVERLDHVFDFIASILVVPDNGRVSAVAVMENPLFGIESRIDRYVETGVGKTALALNILGIPDFLDKLPPFRPDHLATTDEFSPLILSPTDDRKNISIVSLDFSYAGLFEGQLVTSPIMGAEGFDGQSDIARSTTRAKVALAGYKYDRRVPEVSRYYTTSAKKIFLDRKLFVPKDSLIPLTRLVVVNYVPNAQINRMLTDDLSSKATSSVNYMNIDSEAWVALEEVLPEQAEMVATLLFSHNPLYNPSPTWHIDRIRHNTTIQEIQQYLPQRVAYLYVYPGGNGFIASSAQLLFQREASLIREWLGKK